MSSSISLPVRVRTLFAWSAISHYSLLWYVAKTTNVLCNERENVGVLDLHRDRVCGVLRVSNGEGWRDS